LRGENVCQNDFAVSGFDGWKFRVRIRLLWR